MSCRIALITAEQLYSWVDAALVIDAEKMTRSIIVAQDRYIKPILCKDLFDELVSQIENESITTDYQLLLDAIEPTLAFRAYSRYLNSANIDSTEKGLRTWREDNSDVISDKRLGELMKQADMDALSYEQDLQIFLKKNKECYSPFFDDCQCQDFADNYGFKITSVGVKRKKPKLQYDNSLLDNQGNRETTKDKYKDITIRTYDK